MAKLDSLLVKSKFRGCMLGCLIGDCLGGPFEGDQYSPGNKLVVHNYFEKLNRPKFEGPIKQYSDDTAMTLSVARCLIEKPPVDYTHLARLFVKEYFREPNRGYGANVVEVFSKLRSNKFEDIYKPAKEQFNGSGSYGNGGAMRISPIALVFHDNYEGMIYAARKATEITHSHKLGIHGALLQCIAVQQSLLIPPTEKINIQQFNTDLLAKMKDIEEENGWILDDTVPYQTQLKKVGELLLASKCTEDEVVEELGNSIAALFSVPTAIYCFLRAQTDIPGIQSDNIFLRTIEYAVSLGGDTDTIASMAGAIAGAYVGEDGIEGYLKQHSEFSDEIIKIADDLHNTVIP